MILFFLLFFYLKAFQGEITTLEVYSNDFVVNNFIPNVTMRPFILNFWSKRTCRINNICFSSKLNAFISTNINKEINQDLQKAIGKKIYIKEKLPKINVTFPKTIIYYVEGIEILSNMGHVLFDMACLWPCLNPTEADCVKFIVLAIRGQKLNNITKLNLKEEEKIVKRLPHLKNFIEERKNFFLAFFPNAHLIGWDSFLRKIKNTEIKSMITHTTSVGYSVGKYFNEKMINTNMLIMDDFKERICKKFNIQRKCSNKYRITYAFRDPKEKRCSPNLDSNIQKNLIQKLLTLTSDKVEVTIENFTSMNFIDQLQLVANTELFIAPEGMEGNLAAIMPSNGTLIELRGHKHYDHNIQEVTCKAFGKDYIVFDEKGGPKYGNESLVMFDFDLDEIINVIKLKIRE